MKLKTDGERETLRIVSFLQEKLKDRMLNNRCPPLFYAYRRCRCCRKTDWIDGVRIGK
ncbi:hypothetical protein [Holdemania filiformis]|uniref:hypothetical protein n=1 Tax=Holdemania filiformis TaxID=61171 RepID=UPI0024328219|nr:hypothetical protein [Holdemania filiformis]